MKIAVDTSVIISHLKADKFVKDTDEFFEWARSTNQRLIISDVIYELYAGIELSGDPSSEEQRVQQFLAVNGIEARLPDTLEISKRAGRFYVIMLLPYQKSHDSEKNFARLFERKSC